MAPRRRAALTEARTKRPGGVGGERSQNAKGSKGDAALAYECVTVYDGSSSI